MVEVKDVPTSSKSVARRTQREQSSARTARAVDTSDFAAYQAGIMHDWLLTLTLLATTLVPLFFVLDVFMMPHGLLLRFAVYRLISTLLALGQLFVVQRSKPIAGPSSMATLSRSRSAPPSP